MRTVLVKYKVLIDAPHPLLNDEWVLKSEVVEVLKLTDINNMFKNIIDIKVIE